MLIDKTSEDLRALRAQGVTHLLVFRRDVGPWAQGEVLSAHWGYAAARRAEELADPSGLYMWAAHIDAVCTR